MSLPGLEPCVRVMRQAPYPLGHTEDKFHIQSLYKRSCPGELFSFFEVCQSRHFLNCFPFSANFLSWAPRSYTLSSDPIDAHPASAQGRLYSIQPVGGRLSLTPSSCHSRDQLGPTPASFPAQHKCALRRNDHPAVGPPLYRCVDPAAPLTGKNKHGTRFFGG